MHRWLTAIALPVVMALSLAAVGTADGQEYFGKNKVNYEGYDWYYIETEHFVLYFDREAQEAAEFAAKEAERALVRIEKDLKYTLKGRYPIVIYNSHNGFAVSNIQPYELEEFTRGYTEFAQGRVVLPYTGSYAEFRHVIHHELVHAVTIELWTGGGWLGAMMSQAASLPPLWVAEGLAEYCSQGGWDEEGDNFMRYATIAGYVPPINQLNGPFAYKGGQSVFVMIEETYGKDKVTEFVSAFRSARSVDKALKASVGIDLEELNDKWQLWLKRQYWNDINRHNDPEEVAKILTDSREEGGFYNISPSFSPQGDKVAYLTERHGTFDIYLMSAIDGKPLGRLVEGERSSDFESMFVLRPGITWSPDGKQIAFASKSNNKNTLYTMNVRKKKITKRYKFDLDGLFEPAWSPDGKQIGVVGLKNGRSDVFIVNLEDESLRRITDDPFDERHLDWSPDGEWIAFSSDRPNLDLVFDGRKDFPFGNYDVFIIRPDGSEIRRIVESDVDDSHPVWGPDSHRLAFVSNRNGIGNIYIAHLDSEGVYPITNLVSSVESLDWSADGKKMAFNTFHKAGYDIFVLKNPESKRLAVEDLPLTRFIKRQRGIDDKSLVELQREKREELHKKPSDTTSLALADTAEDTTLLDRKIEKWVSDQMALAAAEATETDGDDGALASSEASDGDRGVSLRDWNKEFQIKKYRIKLKPEFFGANAGFDTFYGVSSLVQLSLSDIMGDHRVMLQTSLNFSIKDSDLFLSYANLRHQTDYAFDVFHTRIFYFDRGELNADRYYGGGATMQRPFNKFSRFEMNVKGINISRERLNSYDNPFVRGGYTGGYTRGVSGVEIATDRALILGGALVADNSLTGRYGPVDGRRARLSVEGSFAGMDYTTVQLDYRNYFLALDEYTFAFRMAGGTSFGDNRTVFFVGGVNNPVNPNFSTIAPVDRDKVFFSSFVWPLRGVELFEMAGDSYVLTNLAFRFPLLRQMALGWPLPFFFQNVQGELFLDVGGAFNRDDFDPWEARDGGFELRDLKAGYGLGVRVDVGIFLFRYDLAWPTDFAETFSPIQYFSIDYTGLF